MLVIMCIGQWKQSPYKSFQFQVPSAVTLPATSMRLLAPLIMVSLKENPERVRKTTFCDFRPGSVQHSKQHLRRHQAATAPGEELSGSE